MEKDQAVVQEQYDLITRNLHEVLGGQRIMTILKQRNLKIYWGTATTGRIHLAYFVPLMKVADFVKANCEVTILFADLHAFLDDMKAPLHLVQYRVQYYTFCIKAMLKAIHVPLERLRFVTGSTYQLSPHYTLDAMRLSAAVSQRDALKAGTEVIKQSGNPPLSGMWYPGMQALDEEYLEVDAELGGVDQRKIFTFSEKYLPVLGYEKRSHLLNHMVGGLNGGKMSASDTSSKIDLLDTSKMIAKKVAKTYCAIGDIDNNLLLTLVQHVLLPLLDLMHGETFVIDRETQFGGKLEYATYEQVCHDFSEEKLSPQDLKLGVQSALERVVGPVRDELAKIEEFQRIERLAYPNDEGKGPGRGNPIPTVSDILEMLQSASLRSVARP